MGLDGRYGRAIRANVAAVARPGKAFRDGALERFGGSDDRRPASGVNKSHFQIQVDKPSFRIHRQYLDAIDWFEKGFEQLNANPKILPSTPSARHETAARVRIAYPGSL